MPRRCPGVPLHWFGGGADVRSGHWSPTRIHDNNEIPAQTRLTSLTPVVSGDRPSTSIGIPRHRLGSVSSRGRNTRCDVRIRPSATRSPAPGPSQDPHLLRALRSFQSRPGGERNHGKPRRARLFGIAERKVVTVAVATATDAVQRSILGSGDGVGLRAGTFHTDYGIDAWTTTLTGCAFSKDVIVDGSVLWGVDKSFVADLTVIGSGTSGGALHVEGAWQASGPVGKFKISGTIGGHPVAVLVPEG